MASFSAAVSLLLLSAAPIVLVGCGGRKGAGNGQEFKPFAVTATEDVAHRASRRIEAADGGSVLAVDGQGTRYRLTIPPDALLADTDIVVTPLADFKSAPGQMVRYGVDLAPAGTRLYDFALLEIEPTTPLLPKTVYWLKTEGPASRQLASPGAPAVGKPGMLLWHFSGGVVADVPAGHTTLMEAYTSSDAFQISTASFEGYKNAIQQDYDAGRIDQGTYDHNIEIVDKWIVDSKVQDVKNALAKADAEEKSDLAGAKDAAAAGKLEDAQAVIDVVLEGLMADRQNQLYERPSTIGEEAGATFFVLYKSLLSKCDTQRLPKELLTELEQEAQQLGFETDEDEYQRCIDVSLTKAEYTPPPTPEHSDRRPWYRRAKGHRVQQAAQRVAAYAQSVH